MYTHKTPFFIKLAYPSLEWSKDRAEKKVYLTFDDGPIPGVTEFVLQQLEAFNVKATFFCVGDNVQKHPDVYMRVLEQGHAVGNHTFNHLNGWKVSDDKYIQNVLKCSEAMAENGLGQKPLLFRPPYGKIKRSQIKKLKADYRVIMWDVLSGDFDKGLCAEVCLEKTIKATRNGSIVIFHDSIKAEPNLKWVLPRYLERLHKEGYTFEHL